MSGVILAPSILSADFGRLAEEVARAEEEGADWIHVDVMDGHFVPNISLGPGVTAAVRKATSLPVDVHLMIEHPDRFVAAFRDAGADSISVHVEASPHLNRTLAAIRDSGARAGVALNPGTPLLSVEEVLLEIDLLLIMTVNPGFGGQRFLRGSPDKVARACALLKNAGAENVPIQVDGAVDPETAPLLTSAGAGVLVAGSSLYGAPEGLGPALRRLREAAERTNVPQRGGGG